MCNRCNNPYCGGGCNWPFNRPFYNPPYTNPLNQCRPPVPAPPYACPTCKPCDPCTTVGCLHKIMSDCVIMSKKYTCLGIAATDTLTVAFDKVEALCQSATGGVGVVKFSSTGGDYPETNPDWNPGSVESIANLNYTANQSNYYKITVQYNADGDADSVAQVGVSVNGVDPDTANDFVVANIGSPVIGSAFSTYIQTVVFYLPLNVGDTIQLMSRLTVGTLIEFPGIKMIVERAPLIS